METIEQSLRPILQPITRSLPFPIVNAARQLLGDQCYISLVDGINITDTTCMKLAVSKALGVAIIGASSIVKIPQLLKLINSGSAEGISFFAYLLETSSYLVSLIYSIRNHYDFSTYGEVALIAIQNVAISVLVLQYSGRGAAAAVFVAGLAAAGYALFNDSLTPMATLQYVQAGAGALGVASKIPQIVTIFRQGGTGQLSAFAVFNYLAGSLSRIFTTLQEVPDKLILYGFVAGFALNAVIAAQMLYYWGSATSKSAKSHKLEPSGRQAVDAAVGTGRSTGSGKNKSSPSTRRRG